MSQEDEITMVSRVKTISKGESDGQWGTFLEGEVKNVDKNKIKNIHYLHSLVLASSEICILI